MATIVGKDKELMNSIQELYFRNATILLDEKQDITF